MRVLIVAVLMTFALGCTHTPPPEEEEGLLFTFFRKNGEDGLYLATTEDGLHWSSLNGDQPLLAPMVGESKLMRDPSITRGPDGRFHMVWTTSWDGKTIGYAHSRDLRNWSEQRAIPVMENETEVANCWAPEIFYDEDSGEFIVVWASTIPGRFQETVEMGERGRNHRLFAFRTKDFEQIGPSELFYDPGFLVIDAAIFEPQPKQAGSTRYAMVVKNETRFPPAKNLFLTFAPSLKGPWSKPSDPISGEDWAEGPSPVLIDGKWYIYFDKYRSHRYGVIRSSDLKSWEDLTDQSSFPEGMRHGTVFRAPRSVIDGLRSN
jgi:hypothetical protein